MHDSCKQIGAMLQFLLTKDNQNNVYKAKLVQCAAQCTLNRKAHTFPSMKKISNKKIIAL